MKMPLLCSLVGIALPISAALAQPPAHGEAALPGGEDPNAAVYIVTSRASYDRGLGAMTRRLAARRDGVGSELIVAETTTARLTQISHHIHQTERRCGGYFAFDTRAEAEAFLRADRAIRAMNTTFLADYPIDNQATVDPWLPQVVGHNIYDTLTHLSSAYPNRYYASSHGQSAAVWIRDTWLALANGRSDVSAELFTDCSDCSTQPSVILTIQGAEQPDEIVVLGAHLDSISNAGSGDDMDAPGADDDGSGIATLTEVLRVALADGWRPRRTVKFMGYAAEEVGLRGSRAIAQSFQDEGRNVVGVLQLDMTNYKGGSSVDMRVMTDYTNPQLSQFLKDLFDEYLAPLGLARGTYTCGYACSDHASWTSAGYPSAMMFEATLFPNLHTPYDTLANMDDAVGSSVNFAKLGLAFLGELGKTADAGGGELENGVPVRNVAGGQGSEQRWTLEVPAGASKLRFRIFRGSGDADLYVKFGSAPTTTSFDCRPYTDGNEEICRFPIPQAGIYHVMVRGHGAYSGVTLVGVYSGGN